MRKPDSLNTNKLLVLFPISYFSSRQRPVLPSSTSSSSSSICISLILADIRAVDANMAWFLHPQTTTVGALVSKVLKVGGNFVTVVLSECTRRPNGQLQDSKMNIRIHDSDEAHLIEFTNFFVIALLYKPHHP